MYIHFKPQSQVFDFLHQFNEEKRNQVGEYLLIMGMDMARKLGQRNPKELYHTLKQLARNIEQDSKQNSTELRDEIKKIQYQLLQLNQLFHQPSEKGKAQSNRFYTQNDFEEQTNSFQSPEQQRRPKENAKTSKRSQRNKSPDYVSNVVTAKITESPPPPIVYIQNVNTKFNVKPHLDDQQIKQLLYSENEKHLFHDYDSLSAPNRHQSPLKYTLNLEGESARNHVQTQKKKKKNKKQTVSKGSRKLLPSYLQNVESKIKAVVDHDKQAFRSQKENNQFSDQNHYEENENISENNEEYQEPINAKQQTADFQKNKKLITHQSSSDTYYDIQQYLINQQNQKFDYSPVSEMKADNQVSSTQHFKNPSSKSSLKNSQEYQRKQQNYFDQHEPYIQKNPVLVSDFHLSKQQQNYEQSFDAFRKRAQQSSPYTTSMKQSGNVIPHYQAEKVEEESSDSFSNFTPPNKEVREFFQKQFTYQ